MAVMREKKEHDYLLNLLKKHFNADEIQEAMQDLSDQEDYDEDEDEFEEVSEEMEDEKDDMLPEGMMEEGEEEEEEEEMDLPKDKRKGLAVVIIQKRMSKPKKDM